MLERLEVQLQKRKHALEEQLAGVSVEVELVLMVERRLVVIGIEQRLGLNSLNAKLLDEQLGMRPQRVDVSDGEQRRGKR